MGRLVWLLAVLSFIAPESQGASPLKQVNVEGASGINLVLKPIVASYAKKNLVGISVSTNGSKAANECLMKKTCHIGLVPEESLKKDDSNLTATPFAIAGIEILVSKGSGVETLSVEQLKGIFSGATKNWKEVGGADLPMVVWRRRENGGLHKLFKAIVPVDASLKEVESAVAIQNMFKTTKGAITYISSGIPDNEDSKVIKLDGVEPSSETLRNGRYPLKIKYYVVTHRDFASDTHITGLIDYLMKARGEFFAENDFILP